MEKRLLVRDISKISIEKIADSIKSTRNDRISELLEESILLCFLEENFNTVAISPVKLEFLRRDLKDLQNSSLDLAHYSSLIKQMKETSSYAPVENHPLYLRELKAVFQKYGF